MHPKLRFKEFTDEWQEKKLDEIADVKGGKRIPLGYSLELENNGFPYLTVSGMKNGGIDFNEVKFVPRDIVDQIKNYRISTDDIYVSVAGTLGLVGTIPDSLNGANLTENANKLTNLRANKNFILQYLKSDRFSKLVENVKTNNAQPKLAIYALQGFEMQLPEKEEQSKIADFLTSVDEKINLLEEKKKGFEKYKKGVMQMILSQKIRFNQPDGSNFPDWEEKKLGEIASLIKGQQINGSELDKSGNYPMLNGGIVPSGFTNDWNVDADTITISEGGNSCGFVSYMTQKFWSGGHCYSIQKISSDINILFLFQTLKFREAEIKRLRVGSGLPNIQKSTLSALKLELPTVDEQEKIAEFLTSLDDKVNLINKELEQAKLFKKSLLQQMFVS